MFSFKEAPANNALEASLGGSEDDWQEVDFKALEEKKAVEVAEVEKNLAIGLSDLDVSLKNVGSPGLVETLGELVKETKAQRMESKAFAARAEANAKHLAKIMEGVFDRCDRGARKSGYIEQRLMLLNLTSQEFERLLKQAAGVKKDEVACLLKRELPWEFIKVSILDALGTVIALVGQLEGVGEIQEVCHQVAPE